MAGRGKCLGKARWAGGLLTMREMEDLTTWLLKSAPSEHGSRVPPHLLM
jgi:hypothetical protein